MNFIHPDWEPKTKGEWRAYRLYYKTEVIMTKYRVRRWW